MRNNDPRWEKRVTSIFGDRALTTNDGQSWQIKGELTDDWRFDCSVDRVEEYPSERTGHLQLGSRVRASLRGPDFVISHLFHAPSPNPANFGANLERLADRSTAVGPDFSCRQALVALGRVVEQFPELRERIS